MSEDVLGGDSAPQRDTVADDSSDSADWPDSEYDGLVSVQVTVEINDLAGIAAVDRDGNVEHIAYQNTPMGVALGWVDPGDWRLYAVSMDLMACNANEWGSYAAGDTIKWTLSDLPGWYDTTTNHCTLP